MKLNKNAIDTFKIALFSFFLVVISLWLQGDIGLSLSDEGFLWYGAIHTALGKVPLRDFQSYDPGRYYWSAAWSYLLGSGIMALRISTGIFQGIGLTLGLLAARRAVKSYWKLALVGLVLIVWMYPRHKLFDMSIAMSAVFFAVRLVEKPSFAKHFVAGVFVGLAAFFGRNHGVYSFLAFITLIFFIWLKLDRKNLMKRLGAWGAGILCGYSPMVIMLVFVPGFFDAFVDSILFLFKAGATYLSLPIPWPWNVHYAGLNMAQGLHGFSIGFLFLLMPVFFLLAVISLFFIGKEDIRNRALFVASTLVGVFYMHYAFSRADINHLAHSMHPFLLALVSLPVAFRLAGKKALAAAFACVIFILTVFSIVIESPYYSKYSSNYVQYDIRGDRIWIDKRQAVLLEKIKHINAGISGGDKALLIAPHWPTLYCILGRESPLWQIYFFFPEPFDRQKKMIKALEENNVRWVILGDIALDGRDELRFRNTHGLLWQYITKDFESVDDSGLPENYLLLRKKTL